MSIPVLRIVCPPVRNRLSIHSLSEQMAARPQLLFLAQSLPFPPHSGVQNRTFNVLRQLQVEFDVTVLSFARRNHHRDEAERRAAANSLAKSVSRVLDPVPIPAEYSRIRFVLDHLSSLLAQRRYTDFLYQSDAYVAQLRTVLAEVEFDLVHLDSLDLACYFDHFAGYTVVCTHHDIDSGLMERKASQIRVPVLRQYLHLQSRLIRAVEVSLSPRFAANLVMSERDADQLRAIAPTARLFVVPNGVDTHFFAPRSESNVEPGRVCFVGPTFMYPNRDAIEWFLDRIWPSVRRSSPGATLEMIGRNPPGDAERYANVEAVIPAGYVPDVRPHLAKAVCSVVPIRVGGGTRLKILEAWSFGVPVVSTSIGCDGLNAVDGENILIRDDPDEFGMAVAQVLSDAVLRSRLTANGIRTVGELFSWDRIGANLRELYLRLSGSSKE